MKFCCFDFGWCELISVKQNQGELELLNFEFTTKPYKPNIPQHCNLEAFFCRNRNYFFTTLEITENAAMEL